MCRPEALVRATGALLENSPWYTRIPAALRSFAARDPIVHLRAPSAARSEDCHVLVRADPTTAPIGRWSALAQLVPQAQGNTEHGHTDISAVHHARLTALVHMHESSPTCR